MIIVAIVLAIKLFGIYLWLMGRENIYALGNSKPIDLDYRIRRISKALQYSPKQFDLE